MSHLVESEGHKFVAAVISKNENLKKAAVIDGKNTASKRKAAPCNFPSPTKKLKRSPQLSMKEKLELWRQKKKANGKQNDAKERWHSGIVFKRGPPLKRSCSSVSAASSGKSTKPLSPKKTEIHKRIVRSASVNVKPPNQCPNAKWPVAGTNVKTNAVPAASKLASFLTAKSVVKASNSQPSQSRILASKPVVRSTSFGGAKFQPNVNKTAILPQKKPAEAVIHSKAVSIAKGKRLPRRSLSTQHRRSVTCKTATNTDRKDVVGNPSLQCGPVTNKKGRTASLASSQAKGILKARTVVSQATKDTSVSEVKCRNNESLKDGSNEEGLEKPVQQTPPLKRSLSFTLEVSDSNDRNLPVATPPVKRDKQKRKTVHFGSTSELGTIETKSISDRNKRRSVSFRGSPYPLARSASKRVSAPSAGRSYEQLQSGKTGDHRGTRSLGTPVKKSEERVRKVATPQSCRSVFVPVGKHKEKTLNEKLSVWLKAHGKTPTRYRHIMCFGCRSADDLKTKRKQRQSEPMVKRRSGVQKPFGESLNETLTGLQDTPRKFTDPVMGELAGMLDECMQLVDDGYPQELVAELLDEIETSIPLCKKTAKYWLVRAKLAEKNGAVSDVMDIFEQAISKHAAKPAEELAIGLKDYFQKVNKESTSANNGGKEFRQSGSHEKKSDHCQILSPPVKLPKEISEDEICFPAPAQKSSSCDERPTGKTMANITNKKSRQRPRRRWTECHHGQYIVTERGGRLKFSPNWNDVETRNVFQSSEIKLSLSTNTPIFRKSKPVGDFDLSLPSAVVTPVRRSTRWERCGANLPKMLQEHNQCISRLSDLDPDQKENVVYQPNHALDVSY